MCESEFTKLNTPWNAFGRIRIFAAQGCLK